MSFPPLATIKALIDLVAAGPVAELDVSQGGRRIRILAGTGAAAAAAPAPASAAVLAAEPLPAPEPAPETGLVLAPSYGVFHRAPAPGAEPFTREGAAVAAGQTLGLIEAMKVFTTLDAPRAGTVAAILVANGQQVEPDQPLLRIV